MAAPGADAPPAPPARTSQRFGPWIAATAGLLCYANSLTHGFTYDDLPLVVENPRIRALGNPEIWRTDWWRYPRVEGGALDPRRDLLYRPLTLFTFALNYAAHRLAPWGYHLANVLLHAAVCALVCRLAQRLLGHPRVALFAGLLFAVHPVHCEAVASVVGRAETLSSLFLLLGLLALLPTHGWPALRRQCAAGLCFFLALLAKETAICYPALAALLLCFRPGPRGHLGAQRADLGAQRPAQPAPRAPRPPAPQAARVSATWRRGLPLGLILLVPLAPYFALRLAALHDLIRAGATSILLNPLFDASAAERVHGALTVLGHYTRLLLAPVTLSCDYGLAIVDPHAGPGPMAVLGLLAALALAAGLLGLRSSAAHWRVAGLLCALFLASYALISNTALLIGVAVAERLLYWPSVFFCIGVSYALFARVAKGGWSAAPAWLRVVSLSLLIALGARATARNAAWRSNATLFDADAATFPRGALLQNYRALTLIDRAEQAQSSAELVELLQRADAALEQALSVYSRFPHALEQRGHVALMLGEPERARPFLERALSLDPRRPDLQRLLASLQPASDAAQDVEALRARAAQSPQDAALLVELGAALVAAGDYPGALAAYEQATRVAPDNLAALRGYGQALLLNYREDEAKAVLQQVVERDPSDWSAHANLARLLAENEPAAALTHARRAFELQPQDLRVRLNYAETLVVNQRRDEALSVLRETLRGLDASDAFHAAVSDRIQEIERLPP